MAKSVTQELLALLDYVHDRLSGQLKGLGDDEYLWEPVPGCWTVRVDDDGVHRAQRSYPDPAPAPFTTIAWRMWHIGAECLRGYSVRFFGDAPGPDDADGKRWPGSPDEAAAELFRAWARLRGQIEAMDGDALSQPMGPIAGPYAEDTYHALVLHVLDELIHHSAEIGVLRDLYRATEGVALPVKAGPDE